MSITIPPVFHRESFWKTALTVRLFLDDHITLFVTTFVAYLYMQNLDIKICELNEPIHVMLPPGTDGNEGGDLT